MNKFYNIKKFNKKIKSRKIEKQKQSNLKIKTLKLSQKKGFIKNINLNGKLSSYIWTYQTFLENYYGDKINLPLLHKKYGKFDFTIEKIEKGETKYYKIYLNEYEYNFKLINRDNIKFGSIHKYNRDDRILNCSNFNDLKKILSETEFNDLCLQLSDIEYIYKDKIYKLKHSKSVNYKSNIKVKNTLKKYINQIRNNPTITNNLINQTFIDYKDDEHEVKYIYNGIYIIEQTSHFDENGNVFDEDFYWILNVHDELAENLESKL